LHPHATVSGLLVTVCWRLDHCSGGKPLIDVDLSGFEPARRCPGAVEVASKYARRQTVCRLVRHSDSIIEAIKGHHCNNRPEDLLASQGTVKRGVCEYRGGYERAQLSTRVRIPLTAG